jgi:hypothetical protein
MIFSAAVAEALARSWIELHGRAAEPHLLRMVDRIERASGDAEAAGYRLILEAMRSSASTVVTVTSKARDERVGLALAETHDAR